MRMAEIDDRDALILDELQRDGSLTNAELAERVNLSPSACLRRVNLLKNSGIVEGTRLLLDQANAGFEGTAYVFIALKAQDRRTLDTFETAMTKVPHIQECYLLAGSSDYLLRVVFGTCRIWSACTQR
jgi:Lrp/AsnC family leucine-responsive transcriptional regulator